MSMSTASPYIVDIKGNSLDDGPGIRSVVFLKGCPLACSWCHNPESIRREPVLAFDTGECRDFADCLAVCPEVALDSSQPLRVDYSRCSRCFACVEACASGALSVVGQRMTVAQVLAELRRHIPFFHSSGGGVTLSGGEPTLYLDFCAELLRVLHAEGIHTLLETCGHFSYAAFRARLAPHTDQVYFDLKLADDTEHRRHCGRTNRVILENFRRLAADSRHGGPPVLFRIPLVPGITATDANLAALAALLGENGIRRVALLPYNPLWLEKSAKIGGSARAGTAPDEPRWMSALEIGRCQRHFSGFELV